MAVQSVTRPAPVPARSRLNWPRLSRELTAYAFIAPFFIGFLIFQLGPILFSFYLSVADWNGLSDINFVGLDNFATLVGDERFWNALGNTFVITIVCTILGTAGALLLAVLLEKIPDALATLLRVVFFLPSVTSVVVITYIWKQLYSADYGYFNSLLAQFGLPGQDWLSDPRWAMSALILMLLWAGLGWDALIITSGLRAIPDELYDAGRIDGTGEWSEFRHITLPLLRPTILFVLVTGVIFLWGIFAQPQLLTGGGPLRGTQTIALYLYDTGFRYHKFGYASTIAIVLSVIMFVSSWLNFKFIKTDVEY